MRFGDQTGERSSVHQEETSSDELKPLPMRAAMPLMLNWWDANSRTMFRVQAGHLQTLACMAVHRCNTTSLIEDGIEHWTDPMDEGCSLKRNTSLLGGIRRMQETTAT
jgi:hypothetical protein